MHYELLKNLTYNRRTEIFYKKKNLPAVTKVEEKFGWDRAPNDVYSGWEKVTNIEKTKSPNLNKPPEQTPANNSSEKTTEINRMKMFIPEEPQKSLDNLIVPSTVRNRIDTALNRIKYHDTLYDQWNLKSINPRGKRTAINLF